MMLHATAPAEHRTALFAKSPPMKPLALLWIVCCLSTARLDAAEPSLPKAESTENLVFTDDFHRAELGDGWRVSWPTFEIVDGVLKVSQTKPTHGAVGKVVVDRTDVDVEFKFQFAGTTGINAVFDDPDYKEGHAGHICRVALRPKQVQLADDKERLRHEIEELRKTPEGRVEAARLTAGRSVSFPVDLKSGQWYRLRIQIRGDELSVALDDKPLGSLKSSGIAHPKKGTFHFTVSGKDALFDDLRISSNDPK